MFSYLLFTVMAFLATAGIILLAWRLERSQRETLQLRQLMTKLEADLADRRSIERELAHMASFADMAPNPIIEINADQSIGYVNPAAEQAFPTLVREGMKHPLFDGVLSAVDVLTRDGKTLMTRPINIDQRVFDQQISLLDGGPRVRLYLSDITELKRLDQLKNDFVNMVSHELRTPLTTIAASIKMIASGMLGSTNDDQTNTLQLAQANIDRLARMINDLLDVSKIEAGKLELHRARVDLAALVREVIRSFEPLARERGLKIQARLPPESIEVMIDRDKILQVLTNLINNALKFTEKGYVEVSAVSHEADVQCQVTDTGPGIPPAQLSKVFGKFQQFGTAAKGREKGTGLGLSLCKGFIELHQGKIWVENRSPQGTQFTFVLPQFSPAELFDMEVRRLFSEAVASEKPLSLLRLTLRGWETSPSSEGDKKAAVVANDVKNFIQRTVCRESDPVVDRDGVILIALSETDGPTASDIALRIQTALHQKALSQIAGLPRDISIRIVSYPRDGNLVEELFSKLNA